MGHTYASVIVHGIFSTKERRPFLQADMMAELARVVGGIIRDRGGALLAFNGMPDHVHLLAVLHPKQAIADQFRDIKAVSSKWIHQRFPELSAFAWQTGYGAFSVSKSNAPEVEKYIARQVEHHRRRTFEEEFVALLKRHGIEYDPRYAFD
jgi:REP element-mobilizing transposase RayT